MKPSEKLSGKARELTRLQVWRVRRNLVMWIVHKAGLPQWWLADVFDLPSSSVSTLIREFESEYLRHVETIKRIRMRKVDTNGEGKAESTVEGLDGHRELEARDRG